MKPLPLARSLACVILACASFGAAVVALRSAGEPGRQFVAAPLLALFGLVWLAGARSGAALRLTRAHAVWFAGLLLAGLLLSLLAGFNFSGGETFQHWYRGFPWYWLRVSEDMESARFAWSVDGRSAAADIVFWAGASALGLGVNRIWTKTHASAAGRTL